MIFFCVTEHWKEHGMKKHSFRSAVAVALIVFFAVASPVSADILNPDPERAQHASAGEIAGDLLIIRPIMLGITFIGTGMWVASAPFTLMGQNFGRAAEVMFIDPAMYTFGYPLGSY